MFLYKAIKKSLLGLMIFRQCKRNLSVTSIGATAFLLLLWLSFSLSSFLSSHHYTNVQSIGEASSDDQQALSPKEPEKTRLKTDPCSGRYIYMHDLPARFNYDLVNNCHALSEWFDFCPYLKNRGFGPKIRKSRRLGKSWHATNQFMLSVIFHNRMKQYGCLTENSSLASAVYAPFYPGLEVGRYLFGKFNGSVKDAFALDFATWLRGKPEWGRMFGRDHFFVAGRITWDFRRLTNSNAEWGNKLLNLPELKNTTMLTIESCPYANNDFAIPYPTYFHPSDEVEVFHWQERVKMVKRRYLFAFGGSPRPNDTRSIRGELITQCKNARKNHCKLVSCRPKDDLCNNPTRIIKTFMNSKFCLQPPGDSYTRRSTFDAILAGCIPVFFHPGSAYIQYLWHFPKDYTKYSVFMRMDGVKNGSISVEKMLSEIPEQEVLDMRDEVIKLIPQIIYAKRKLETIEDAFDIAIKGILQRIGDAREKILEGKDPSMEFPEESRWKYYLTGKVDKHEWDSFFSKSLQG